MTKTMDVMELTINPIFSLHNFPIHKFYFFHHDQNQMGIGGYNIDRNVKKLFIHLSKWGNEMFIPPPPEEISMYKEVLSFFTVQLFF